MPDVDFVTQSHRRKEIALNPGIVEIELPEFLICALQARLKEVNTGAPSHELCSLHNLIESELVSLFSVRDVAELEQSVPGFAQAVQQWLSELRE